MFSARKGILKATEAATFVMVVVCLGTALMVRSGDLPPAQVEPFVVPGMILVFAVVVVCLALASEFSKVLGRTPSSDGEVDLSLADWWLLSRWCPATMKLAYLLAIAVALYTLFAVGLGVSWSTGEAFTQREALGFPLFGATMLLILLPMLASAARMPGAYVEHFHPRLRRSKA
jgi:hypothetical protein